MSKTSALPAVENEVINRPLPPQPFKVDIRGMHGQSVELDPRRIKFLESNPRGASNPGFTEESLEILGEGIVEVQQQEDVKVIPLVGDPKYDAQLYDGERRARSCLHASVSVIGKVREDIDPNDDDALFLLAVACNSEKEPHTPMELVTIVRRMREMGKTNRDIGIYIGKHETRVSQLYNVSKMDPKVVALLDEGLSIQIALLLKDLKPEEQVRLAGKILQEEMGHHKAKRYLMGIHRKLGKQAPIRKGRPKRGFESLVSLAEQSEDRFGLYLDMNPSEVTAMIQNVPRADRNRMISHLRFLASCLGDVATMIETGRRGDSV